MTMIYNRSSKKPSKIINVTVLLVLVLFYPALSQAASGSLSVGFAGTHGSRGAFLDITANQDLQVTSFDLNLGVGSVDITIYQKVGATTVADTTNPGAWTTYQTVNVTGVGQGTGTNVPINPFPITNGQTIAFLITADTNGVFFNATGDGATSSATDAAMSIFSAFETHSPFDPSSTYEGWPWQGTVNYNIGAVPVSATPVPTLSQWGVILLVILLGFVGVKFRKMGEA